MFTGIIQFTGSIKSTVDRPLSTLVIKCQVNGRSLKIGESVAVNGCCLTVVAKKGKALTFDLSAETLKKTNLGSLKKNDVVNLERALRVGDRLSGHFVLGHVDGVGRIVAINKKRGSVEMAFTYPKTMRSWLIDKGSVAVDGISLTCMLRGASRFKVVVIPHTWRVTNLAQKKVGDLVNLEGDVLGKYAVKNKK